ncbi:MAG: peptidylprolyl isomerase [Bacteroidota bacterium]|nr:peptidylprolyl isomerase [Candidatus Kapabacteria bacterium]MDW8220738.1 peptidylprolyl isomerase [Bacteroidota bacterium]
MLSLLSPPSLRSVFPIVGVLTTMLVGWSSCQNYLESERLRRFLATSQTASHATSPNTSSIAHDTPSTFSTTDTVPVITHYATIRTSIGTIILGLYGIDAPQTVENFVKLAEKKFFRGILFHRVARNFVIQTGDPKTKDKRKKDEWGTGGESAFGEPFPDEIVPDAPSVKRGYRRGTVAMATRSPDANTSQFFICLRDIPELPLQFTIFGEVVKGWEIVEKIAAGEITPQLNENDGRPIKPVAITRVTVVKLRTSAPQTHSF